jgi:hypothetical protein
MLQREYPMKIKFELEEEDLFSLEKSVKSIHAFAHLARLSSKGEILARLSSKGEILEPEEIGHLLEPHVDVLKAMLEKIFLSMPGSSGDSLLAQGELQSWRRDNSLRSEGAGG